ncbi:MAG: hypothetical protein WA154_10880 [Moraxellaceae bacterium]
MAGISKEERARRAAEKASGKSTGVPVSPVTPAPAAGEQNPPASAPVAPVIEVENKGDGPAVPAAAPAKAAEDKKPDTVRMKRDEPLYPKGKTTADVHPAEVENMRAHGWRVE